MMPITAFEKNSNEHSGGSDGRNSWQVIKGRSRMCAVLRLVFDVPDSRRDVGDMSGIFISYRQDDSKPWAVLLRDTLAQAFG
jgi:hypothetical protein